MTPEQFRTLNLVALGIVVIVMLLRVCEIPRITGFRIMRLILTLIFAAASLPFAAEVLRNGTKAESSGLIMCGLWCLTLIVMPFEYMERAQPAPKAR